MKKEITKAFITFWIRNERVTHSDIFPNSIILLLNALPYNVGSVELNNAKI